MVALCPHCGQPMLVRHGIKFPPKKADILDMIEMVSKARGGIELETLIWVFYPGVSRYKARDRIRNHICQINDMLASTDFRIVSRGGLYRFEKAP